MCTFKVVGANNFCVRNHYYPAHPSRDMACGVCFLKGGGKEVGYIYGDD